MKKLIQINKYFFLIFGCVFIFYACPLCIESYSDNGPLNDEAKLLVPYKDQGIYSFKYNDTLIINFDAYRGLEQGIDQCAECCYGVKYEIDKTVLTSDYPLFKISFEVDNLDTSDIHFYAKVGPDYFYIPTPEWPPQYVEKSDSMMVNSFWYINVYKLKSSASPNSNYVYADTMFYNYDYGILKIKMSDGKDFTYIH